ncbi:MAG TPA: hypothetical protein VK717_04370 [Opitutaceae bacterium]|jgi:hypothetical protein|nr:hypothetical protein [Opitutaceae bacterium]
MREFLPLIPLLTVPLVIGFVIWAAVAQKRRTTANLQKLAAQLGLEYVTAVGWMGRARVNGTLLGRKIDFFSYVTGSGKSSTTWAAVTAQAATAGPLTFTLQKQGFGTKIAELFGAHEITVGDGEFDAAWFVQTNQPEFLRAALIPELRAKLMAVRRAGATGKFELKGSEIKYAEVGTFAEVKRIERFATLADVMCDLASVAEVAAEGQGRT